MRDQEAATLAPSYSIVFLGAGETSAEQSLISEEKKKKKKITSEQDHISLSCTSQFLFSPNKGGKESSRS